MMRKSQASYTPKEQQRACSVVATPLRIILYFLLGCCSLIACFIFASSAYAAGNTTVYDLTMLPDGTGSLSSPCILKSAFNDEGHYKVCEAHTGTGTWNGKQHTNGMVDFKAHDKAYTGNEPTCDQLISPGYWYCKDGCGYTKSGRLTHIHEPLNYHDEWRWEHVSNYCARCGTHVTNAARGYHVNNGVSFMNIENIHSYGTLTCDICNLTIDVSKHNCLHSSYSKCHYGKCGIEWARVISINNKIDLVNNNTDHIEITYDMLGHGDMIDRFSVHESFKDLANAYDIGQPELVGKDGDIYTIRIPVTLQKEVALNNQIKLTHYVWMNSSNATADYTDWLFTGAKFGKSQWITFTGGQPQIVGTPVVASEKEVDGWKNNLTITSTWYSKRASKVQVALFDPSGKQVSDWISGAPTGNQYEFKVVMSPKITNPQERYYTLKCKDDLQGNGEGKVLIPKTDIEPPVIVSEIDLTQGWETGKEYDAQATDAGIGRIELSFNGDGDYQLGSLSGSQYLRSFRFIGDVYTEQLRLLYLKDGMGNVQEVRLRINKIDGTAPTITNAGYKVNTGQRDAVINIAAHDQHPQLGEGSGVKAYAVTRTAAQPTDGWNTTAANTVSDNGTYYTWTRDAAGNVSAPAQVNVSGISAGVTVKYINELGEDISAGFAMEIPKQLSDEQQSTISLQSYPREGYEFHHFSLATEDGKTASATLNLDNTLTFIKGDASVLTLHYVDKIPPTITNSEYAVKEGEREGVISATAQDLGTGVGGYALTRTATAPTEGWQTAGEWTVSDVGTYYIWARDRAGNISTAPTHITANGLMADVVVKYVDELGNDISAGFAMDVPELLSGEQLSTVQLQSCPQDFYEFQYFSLNTEEGKSASAALNADNTLTFIKDDASVLTLHYKGQAKVGIEYVDELGNDIYDLFPEAPETTLMGYRTDEAEIPHPELEWYEWQHNQLATLEDKEPSGFIDSPEDGAVTFGIYDASTLNVQYKGKAVVNIRYVDEKGNDISSALGDAAIARISGYRNDTANIPTPYSRWYEFKGYSIDTRPGADVPSGYIDNSKDSSVTFGLKDKTTITVVYHARADIRVAYEDERGSNIRGLFANTLPSIFHGLRGWEWTIPTPEIDFYEFQGYELHTQSGEEPSGFIDGAIDNTVTLGIRDSSSVTVRYKGWGIVNIEYVDEQGNDIRHVFGSDAVTQLRGYRSDEAEIPTPENRWYKFKRYDIETAADAECSGYIDNNQDNTITFGLRDKTTIKVVYHAKAEIKLAYVDELGNDIRAQLERTPPEAINGLRGAAKGIPIPESEWYEWQHNQLTTTRRTTPSGFLADEYDTTATFGHEDASEIAVVYHAHAEVPFNYVDTMGNDLMALGILPEETVEQMAGKRGETFEFSVFVPDHFELKSVRLIRSTAGEAESTVLTPNEGGLYSAQFNVGNSETIQVLYEPLPFVLTLTDPQGRGLAGGGFVIADAKGKDVYTGITDADGLCSVPAPGAGGYYITQVDAPDGYYCSNTPWEVSLNKHNEAQGVLKYTNYPIIKTVVCIDGHTKEPIAGAVIGVYNSNNELITQSDTNTEGKASFWLQKDGHYTFKQISVTEPYTLSGKVHTVKITGKTTDEGNNTYTFRNVPPVQTGAYNTPLLTLVTTAVLGAGMALNLVRMQGKSPWEMLRRKR